MKQHETGELFSRSECEEYFREEVRAAGGAKKWLRKHKFSSFEFSHCLHLIENGGLFDNDRIRERLGFQRIERWMAMPPRVNEP